MSILNVQKVLNDETMLLAFIGLSIIVALLASATLYFAICKINPKVNTKKDIKNAAHTPVSYTHLTLPTKRIV